MCQPEQVAELLHWGSQAFEADICFCMFSRRKLSSDYVCLLYVNTVSSSLAKIELYLFVKNLHTSK